MSRPLHSFLSLTCLMILATACGGYKETEVVDYRIYLDTNDAGMLRETRRLVAYYNERMGSEALKVSPTREGANSAIIWTKGLQAQDGKLGYGQWQTSTKQDSQFVAITGKTPSRTVKYSMNIEFDQDFFITRMTKAQTSPEWQELFVLFCHEVGHGLTMNHDEDPKSVMYKYIDGAAGIKFDEYFSRAKAFFASH